MMDRRNARALALAFALVSAAVAAGPAPARANEKAGGGGGCPWAQDIVLDLGKKTLKISQDAISPYGEPIHIDGFQIYPLLDQLKLRIVGPRGQEWEAAMTRLSGGKRCNAFYAGKPTKVFESEEAEGKILKLVH